MAERCIRCAIYTRKSTEDGLEQAFNSLDAQYEACAAYALSQRHEGWELIDRRYDDGGYSGGTMERPGLKRLLVDVEAGLIDVILLYKIDRLTRSLSDFSRIVEVLDKAEASFVSITQAFNTTTSMGRLTLNMLLSFAQFEREVTGERIRDKIAASKRKGIWMGGPVPLGYKVKERKLVPVQAEADQVRHIMERYIALGTVPALVRELERDGYRTKLQKRASGPHKGGCVYRRGTLYHLLSNPIYRGMITHKGDIYEGEHKAIIEPELWEKVQRQLKANASGSSRRKQAKDPSLLIGLIEDRYGRPMTPSHSGKSAKTRRYRYYVTRPDHVDDRPAQRVSAPDLEARICEHLTERLGDDGLLLDLVGEAASAQALGQARAHADRASATLKTGDALGRSALLQALVDRVKLAEAAIELRLNAKRLCEELKITSRPNAEENLTFELPAITARVRHQLRLIVPGSAPAEEPPPQLDHKLIRLVAEALEARELVLAQPARSLSAIARDAGKCRTRLGKLVCISCLAPSIIESIVQGTQPQTLTAKRLLTQPIPLDWKEQVQWAERTARGV